MRVNISMTGNERVPRISPAARVKARSPTSTLAAADQRALSVSTPRRSRDPSTRSSWMSVAVCSISIAAARFTSGPGSAPRAPPASRAMRGRRRFPPAEIRPGEGRLERGAARVHLGGEQRFHLLEVFPRSDQAG